GASLVVDGSGAGVNADYAITATTVTRSTPAGFGGVTYSNLTSLLLTVGSGANVVDVTSTAAAAAVTANAGADTVNVAGTGLGAALTVNTGSEDDTVTVGGSPGFPVTIDGGTGTDTVNVNGSAVGDKFTVGPNGTRVAVARVSPSPFALDIGTVETVT